MENESSKPDKKRACDYCSNEYVFDKVTSKFCSNVCRSNASKKARLGNVNNAPLPEIKIDKPTQTPPMYAQSNQYASLISPPAQMMITHHEKEAQRWEKKYDAEVTEHKSTKQKVEDLQRDLRDNEKPGGLNGFLGTESGVEIVKVFAPLLARVAESQLDKKQIAGVDGEAKEITDYINGWYGNMQPQTQQEFQKMIALLSKMDSEQSLYLIQTITTKWQ